MVLPTVRAGRQSYAYAPRERWVPDVEDCYAAVRLTPGLPHASGGRRLSAGLNFRWRCCRLDHHGPTSDEVGMKKRECTRSGGCRLDHHGPTSDEVGMKKRECIRSGL